jgi:hypothetical protein
MIQLQLPRPEQYSNWQDWARALLAVLQAQSVRPAIKGAKGGNVALTNLLQALAQSGVVDDQTT